MRASHAAHPTLLAALLLLLQCLGQGPSLASAAAAAAGPTRGGASAGASGAVKPAPATELATLASKGDALQLWERATATAADAVVEALRRQDPEHEVKLLGADLDDLRIWHGQSVSLGLEAGGQRYSFVVQSEPEWQRLASVLGAAEGGLLPRHDWDALQKDWLNPVSRGSLLPDFALEGPLDVYLAQPTALQLFLPHATDAGTVQRVLLREGAVVMVRGARAVRLRRGLDLPPIGLSEFAGIVTADAGQEQPLGVMHLLAGVQAAAQARWNVSHPDQSLGLVALELDLHKSGAALLTAPGTPRLRVRRVTQGAVELLPRDGPAASPEAARSAVALPADAAAEGAALSGPWPLKSVHPAQLQSYEKLLRQVITSRLFRTGGAGGGLRVAKDVQLRLADTEAEATTLLQMQLELKRWPKLAGSAAGAAEAKGPRQGASGSSSGGSGTKGAQQAGAAELSGGEGGAGSRPSAAAYLASLDDPPDTPQLLAFGGTRLGPHETWTATVQIKGDAQRGTLKFVPLHLQRVGVAADTVQFAPQALASLFGLGNGTDVSDILLM